MRTDDGAVDSGSGPALAGCSLYDDLEIRDMCVHLREDSEFIVIPRCPYFLLEQFYCLFSLFTFFQHSARDQDKRSCWSDLTSLEKGSCWEEYLVLVALAVGGTGGCIEYVLCSLLSLRPTTLR